MKIKDAVISSEEELYVYIKCLQLNIKAVYFYFNCNCGRICFSAELKDNKINYSLLSEHLWFDNYKIIKYSYIIVVYNENEYYIFPPYNLKFKNKKEVLKKVQTMLNFG